MKRQRNSDDHTEARISPSDNVYFSLHNNFDKEPESLVPFGCNDWQSHVIPAVNGVTDVSSGPASYALSLLQDALPRESRPEPKQPYLPPATYSDICIQRGTAIPEPTQDFVPNCRKSYDQSDTTQFHVIPAPLGSHSPASTLLYQHAPYQDLPANRRALLGASSCFNISLKPTTAREDRSQV